MRRGSPTSTVVSLIYASSFVGSLNPTTDYGETLSLTALTVMLQTQFPFPATWGSTRPVWRLVAHGPLADLAGPATARAFTFVMAIFLTHLCPFGAASGLGS